MKTRQPLGQALVSAPGWSELPEGLRREVAEELNVTRVATLAAAGEVVDVQVKPNFRALGKRFGKDTKTWADKIQNTDPEAIAAAFYAGKPVVIDGEELGPDEIILSEAPASGWAVASAGPDTVALDLELTHELRLAGLLRDIVRIVQDARKAAGLEVTDRIALSWQVGGSPEPAEAIETHRDQLASEVLAESLHEGRPDQEADLYTTTDLDLGLTIWLQRA